MRKNPRRERTNAMREKQAQARGQEEEARRRGIVWGDRRESYLNMLTKNIIVVNQHAYYHKKNETHGAVGECNEVLLQLLPSRSSSRNSQDRISPFHLQQASSPHARSAPVSYINGSLFDLMKRRRCGRCRKKIIIIAFK